MCVKKKMTGHRKRVKHSFSVSSETSQVFFVEIPLNAEGRLTDTHRLNALSTRKVDLYRSIYLEPWVKDLTLFYKLPKPGLLDLHCFVPTSGGINLGELEENIGNSPGTHPALWILPETPAGHLEALIKIARNHRLAFAVSLKEADGRSVGMLITPEGIQHFCVSPAAEKKAFPFKMLHYGPAAVTMKDRWLF